MSRVNPRTLDSGSRMKYLDLLWTSIAQLETRQEVKQFFKDLLSESEAIMLARRIEVARRLVEGQSYGQISNELKIGTDTVSRVQRWLASGFGGYDKAIKGFEKELEKRTSKISRENEAVPYSFDWIRKKYPLHFLIYNLLSRGKSGKNNRNNH